jgi:hypothetical protein
MRDILGKQGGELLVSVLRDMLAGKVTTMLLLFQAPVAFILTHTGLLYTAAG